MATAGSLPADFDAALRGLLDAVRRRFYAGQPPRLFHRDRRALLYALSWPAAWLESRGLGCSPARYHALIADRLDAIALHGDPTRYGAYFPAYFLQSIQDWFHHRGDGLYAELKQIRDAIDRALGSIRFAPDAAANARQIEILAATHRLLHEKRTRRAATDHRQLSLF
jgi:hypothetical protein